MRPFLVCIHDATPAFERETRAMLRDLAPIVGREVSCGVVPDWHGAWSLAAHRDYCLFLQDAAAELLLHGYRHERAHGRGPVSWLAGRSDEMNGVDGAGTHRLLQLGQAVFADAFGARARGFIPPAWQRGHVDSRTARQHGLEYVMGYGSLDGAVRSTSLATWTWHCGRWGWLGYAGDALGALRHALRGGVPVLALHPLDRQHGFWPRILRLTRELAASGFAPTTPASLLETHRAEVRV